MAGMVFLTGEAPDLALAEVKGALKAMGKDIRVEDPDDRIALLRGDPPAGLAPRLGFSHFSGTIDDVSSLDMENILNGVSSAIQKIDEDKSISWLVKVPKEAVEFSSSDLFKYLPCRLSFYPCNTHN